MLQMKKLDNPLILSPLINAPIILSLIYSTTMYPEMLAAVAAWSIITMVIGITQYLEDLEDAKLKIIVLISFVGVTSAMVLFASILILMSY